jgi:hypothetical protein
VRLHPHFCRRKEEEMTAATAKARDIHNLVEVDQVVWSIECTVDELQLDLCRAREQITIDQNFYVDGQKQVKTLTVKKYYAQAFELMKWIPILRPSPEFVINTKDLSPKVIEELEGWIEKPTTLSYILKQAVGRIFENISFDYYHIKCRESKMFLVRFLVLLLALIPILMTVTVTTAMITVAARKAIGKKSYRS